MALDCGSFVEDSCLNIALYNRYMLLISKLIIGNLRIYKRTVSETERFLPLYKKGKSFMTIVFMSNEIKVKINTQHIIATPDEDSYVYTILN